MPVDRPPPVQKISPRHRKMILMAALGRRPGEIAREIGVSPTWLSVVMNSPAFKLQVEHIQKSIESEATATQVDVLIGHVPEAIQKIKYLMDTGAEETTQLSAAKDILDRTIPKKTAHTEERVLRLDIPGSALALLARAVAEDEDKQIDDAQFAEVEQERRVGGQSVSRQLMAKMPEELED